MLKKDCCVGSRVKAITNADGEYETLNEIGTIEQVDREDCTVNFDNSVGGWRDESLNIRNGHGLFVAYEELELINE